MGIFLKIAAIKNLEAAKIVLDFIEKSVYTKPKKSFLERCLRKRSKGRWDSLLPDWGQIIAIENCSVHSVPLSII